MEWECTGYKQENKDFQLRKEQLNKLQSGFVYVCVCVCVCVKWPLVKFQFVCIVMSVPCTFLVCSTAVHKTSFQYSSTPNQFSIQLYTNQFTAQVHLKPVYSTDVHVYKFQQDFHFVKLGWLNLFLNISFTKLDLSSF